MKLSVAVLLGGASGAVLRLFVNTQMTFSQFPFATFTENISGSFLLGCLTGIAFNSNLPEWVRVGIGTGFCGGFTTMSTFAADSITLWQTSSTATIIYIGSSVAGGLTAAMIGIMVGLKLSFIWRKVS
ncbi:fluoride efflux transporter FluC [Bacillus solimangrovi]|uniref:Fluoride-specific ion channel FluC n=1 Tax=Bacillus solimangrovi TaxID=1305675 RepID=A0A1E5LJK4_9BACI|nr:CrcB family protein [Bacillus solimangrovi]OEH94255.1 hypothetical protein BFG57_09220 [Bacillus solimangrovi]